MNNKIILGVIIFSVLIVGGIFTFKPTPKNEPGNKTTKNIETNNQISDIDSNLLADNYTLNTEKSIINWKAERIIGNKHYGTVIFKNGFINLTEDGNISGEFVADMTSLLSLDASGKMKEMLENHLKSTDFFDTTNFPEAKFVITNSEKQADNKYLITGDMTIKNITNEIQVPVELSQENNTPKATTEFYIDRTLWDIHYDSGKFFATIGDKAIRDEIQFNIEVYAST